MIDFDKLLDDEMDWAIAQRRALGPGNDDFQMRVQIVGPVGQIAKTPLQWTSEQEKHKCMYVLAEVCRITVAQAAIVTSDIRRLEVDAFCKHFGIAPPTPSTLDAFERERQRVMKPFDFYMGNLPPHLYADALMCFAYGPAVKKIRCCEYRASDGRLIFDPQLSQVTGLQIDMLRPWWS
jgi:hypothetical protein